MTKWPQVRAGDVLQLVRRPVDPDPATNYVEIGVRSFGNGIFHKPNVTGADIGKKRVFEIGPHELVINIVFAWEGAVAVSSADEIGMIGSHRFLTYQGDPERVDLEFVRAYLVSEPGRVAVTAASPGSAGRNRTLSQSGFERLMIPLPPLDEQRRIAAQIAGAGRVLSAINGLRQRASRLARASIDAMIFSESADAPVVKIADVLRESRHPVAVEPGRTYRTAGIYSYARGLFWRPRQDGSEIKYRTLFRVATEQIVMSKLFAWEGAIALADDDFEGALVSPEFPTFDVDQDRAHPGYLRAAISRADFYTALAVSGMGDRRQRVNPAQFLAASVPLPSLDIQRAIAGADARRRQIEQLTTHQRSIAAVLESAMLNEVFSGRV